MLLINNLDLRPPIVVARLHPQRHAAWVIDQMPDLIIAITSSASGNVKLNEPPQLGL